MPGISHPCLLNLDEIHKAVNPVYNRPYVSLSLFITTISVCSFLCSHVNYLVRAENAPTAIHIGALVSYDTFIGRSAAKAIQLALEDIKKDRNLLNSSELVLHLVDTNCSAFTGVAAGKTHRFFMFLYVPLRPH